MNDIPTLAIALLIGGVLGTIFFVGLWWTVQKAVTSQWPALWFLGSLILRTGLIMTGFYLAAQGHWSRLIACLSGFLVARFIVVKHFSRSPIEENARMNKETGNAHQP
jgi:F1F0 ATPase subunit 2